MQKHQDVVQEKAVAISHAARPATVLVVPPSFPIPYMLLWNVHTERTTNRLASNIGHVADFRLSSFGGVRTFFFTFVQRAFQDKTSKLLSSHTWYLLTYTSYWEPRRDENKPKSVAEALVR